jgi:hypothetical protein
MNQETGWCDNTDNLYPTYTEPLPVHILFNYLMGIIGRGNKLAVKCWICYGVSDLANAFG